MSDQSSSAPAGWYPDPGGSASQRYWDGVTWGDLAGPEPTTPPGYYPDPENPSRSRYWDGVAWAPAEATRAVRLSTYAGGDNGPPSKSRVRPLVIALVVALVAAGGYTYWTHGKSTLSSGSQAFCSALTSYITLAEADFSGSFNFSTTPPTLAQRRAARSHAIAELQKALTVTDPALLSAASALQTSAPTPAAIASAQNLVTTVHSLSSLETSEFARFKGLPAAPTSAQQVSAAAPTTKGIARDYGTLFKLIVAIPKSFAAACPTIATAQSTTYGATAATSTELTTARTNATTYINKIQTYYTNGPTSQSLGSVLTFAGFNIKDPNAAMDEFSAIPSKMGIPLNVKIMAYMLPGSNTTDGLTSGAGQSSNALCFKIHFTGSRSGHPTITGRC